MSDAPRAITGSLVDAKNIAVHKSIRLSVDVPAELGEAIIKLFGWPTMAAPVPVALARLEVVPDRPVQPKSAEHKTGAGDGKRQWSELSPAQQASMRCKQSGFHSFLRDQHPFDWEHVVGEPQQECASKVRTICGVRSRADLNTDSAAAARWHDLDISYLAWERVQ